MRVDTVEKNCRVRVVKNYLSTCDKYSSNVSQSIFINARCGEVYLVEKILNTINDIWSHFDGKQCELLQTCPLPSMTRQKWTGNGLKHLMWVLHPSASGYTGRLVFATNDTGHMFNVKLILRVTDLPRKEITPPSPHTTRLNPTDPVSLKMFWGSMKIPEPARACELIRVTKPLLVPEEILEIWLCKRFCREHIDISRELKAGIHPIFGN